MRLTPFRALALAGVAMFGLFAAMPAPAHALGIAAARLDPPFFAPASQTIEIDGRFITVELSVTRAIGGAPIDPPPQPTTTVHVTLSVNDGAALPAGLDAVGVRFEKLRGIRRFFFTPISEVDTIDPLPGDEVDQADFQGDLSDHPSVVFLRAVVRLELDGEVIKVPMGIVRVNVLLLP